MVIGKLISAYAIHFKINPVIIYYTMTDVTASIESCRVSSAYRLKSSLMGQPDEC